MLCCMLIAAGTLLLGVDDLGQWLYGWRGSRREAYLELMENARVFTVPVPSSNPNPALGCDPD